MEVGEWSEESGEVKMWEGKGRGEGEGEGTRTVDWAEWQ